MIEIYCTDENKIPIDSLTQWDVNQKIYVRDLNLKESPIIHICNSSSETALCLAKDEVSFSENTLSIPVPNILLQESERIFVYLYTYNEATKSGKTVYIIKIPVREKKRPDDYVYEENIKGVNIVDLDIKVKNLQDWRRDANEDITLIKNQIAEISSNTNNVSSSVTVLSQDLQSLLQRVQQLEEKIEALSP